MALSYNGIDFTYPLTTGHVYGPVKDPSGSDQLYTELTITAESFLTVGLLPWTVQQGNAAEILTKVRHYLTQPRGSLYYDLTSLPGQKGASPVINIPDGRDDATGPWPDEKGFQIKYTTPGTLFVRWSCTARIRDCGNPDQITAPLSHRWVDSLAWDSSSKCTYTRNGTLILSSKSTENLDWWRRNKLAPPITPGFRRASTNFTMSSDFLRCDYTIVDEQIRNAPPGNAVRMNITQSESAPIGQIRKGAVAVTLVGLQNSSVVDLSRWALIIMAARVKAARALQVAAGGTVSLMGVVNLETREPDDGVEVTASCTYKVNPSNLRDVGLIGAPAAAWAAARGSVQQLLLNGQTTQQGKPAQGLPVFPWVGFGTSGQTAQNPGGFASWANPTASVGGPADGVGTAAAISLYAALLNDPCSSQLSTGGLGGAELRTSPDPNAAPFQPELRGAPSQYNTPGGGGQGGQSPTLSSTSQLSVALSTLNAAQYPATVPVSTADGLWVSDGEPGVYDLWQCSNEYADDPGVMVVPTCTTDGKNKRVDYGSAAFTLVRRWVAKRLGAPPQFPPRAVVNPDGTLDTNWVYVGGDPAPAVREMSAGADSVDFLYQAEGVYRFQCLDASQVVPAAEIPPFMNPMETALVSNWPYGAAGPYGIGGGGSRTLVGVSISASVSSPLGSGSLLVTVNP